MSEFYDGAYDRRSFAPNYGDNQDPGREMDNLVSRNALNIMREMGVNFAPGNMRGRQDYDGYNQDMVVPAIYRGDDLGSNVGPVDWQSQGDQWQRGQVDEMPSYQRGAQAFYGQNQEVYRDSVAYDADQDQDATYRPEAVRVAQVERQYSAERPVPQSGWSAYDFAAFDSLNQATRNLEGHSIKEFDRNIDPDVGCARGVSKALSDAYGYDIREVNVRKLEGTLKGLGFTEVSTRDIKPGDVILANRTGGDYSHSAIYMGNGQIFNNDSELGVMRRQSIDKFNSAEFKRFVILRRPAEVPALLR